ncbi:UNVERIFIED_CONTAM: protein NRT1/ PTR FAMILY 8.1 [Sesamum latifolium]|uniref:Protein NRT1/ PTR FAMILY 8.1 n=1 Tax=Sesamum latifolium TaxID=2727402 RepID=A0AAW2X8B1_9LAMI
MEVIGDEDMYAKDGTLDCRNNPANKKKTGAWKTCPFILAYYGMSSNLLLYYTSQLNQHSATASRNLSNWLGTCYILPLVGAFLADAYLGRYWTIASFSVIYVLGMTLLALSASVPGLRPTCYKKDECYATDSQTAVFSVALYLVALGSGGMKPCVSSYGADQFDDADEVEKGHKSSFFNWLYFSTNIGVLIDCSIPVLIQVNIGWGWRYGVSAMAMAIAVVFFFSGARVYRYQKSGGNPLTRLCQVLVASLRKYRVEVPGDESILYEAADVEATIVGSRKLDHTNQFRFLDKAAVEKESDHSRGSVNPWRLCTVTQVEELKWIIRLLPVLATGIIFNTVFGQMSNLFLLQAEYMDTRLGLSNFKIPVASLAIFNPISVIFWVPIYDRFIIPVTRKFTGHKNGLTQLQRIGTGLFISVFGMISAGVLEMFRLGIVRRQNSYKVMEAPISVFWQVPQHVIVGCAEVFTNIGQLEFFYEQAPDSMRSLYAALSLTTTALGNYLSSLLVAIVMAISTRNGRPGWIPDNLNYGHLHYFFLLLAVLSVLNLGVFIVVAKRYSYNKQ